MGGKMTLPVMIWTMVGAFGFLIVMTILFVKQESDHNASEVAKAQTIANQALTDSDGAVSVAIVAKNKAAEQDGKLTEHEGHLIKLDDHRIRTNERLHKIDKQIQLLELWHENFRKESREPLVTEKHVYYHYIGQPPKGVRATKQPPLPKIPEVAPVDPKLQAPPIGPEGAELPHGRENKTFGKGKGALIRVKRYNEGIIINHQGDEVTQ